MPSVIFVRVVILSVIVVCISIANTHDVIMLCVSTVSHFQRHYAKCRGAECRGA
jgi:hypothetical protein